LSRIFNSVLPKKSNSKKQKQKNFCGIFLGRLFIEISPNVNEFGDECPLTENVKN
jgi:hypothetical protein